MTALMRSVDARIIDRVTHSPLAGISAATISIDESWSPTIQVDVTRPNMPIEYPTAAIRNAQGDWLTLEALTHFSPLFAVAALTARYGGKVSTVTAQRSGSVERMTAAHSTAWNSGEELAPLSTATTKWGGLVSAVTAAAAGDISRLTWALRQPGSAFKARASERAVIAVKIREVTTDSVAQTITYRCVSADIRLHDYRRTQPTTLTFATTSLRQLIHQVWSEIPDIELAAVQVWHAPDVTIPTGTLWKPGQAAWDVLAPILEAVDYRLYADLDGTLRLAHRTEQPAALILDKQTNLTEWEHAVDYQALNAGGAVIEYTDIEDTDPARFDIYSMYSALTILHETRPGRPAAPGAAEWLTTRTRARARTADAETVLELTAAPLTRVQVRAGAVAQYGTIQSLTHDLKAGQTRYRLRDLT